MRLRVYGAEVRQSIRTGLPDLARRERGDRWIVSEVGEQVDGLAISTDERGTKSEVFRAPDINPLRKSSGIANEVAESQIKMSGRVHSSLRSVIRTEGMERRVVDSMDEEGEGTETVEVSVTKGVELKEPERENTETGETGEFPDDEGGYKEKRTNCREDWSIASCQCQRKKRRRGTGNDPCAHQQTTDNQEEATRENPAVV